MIILLGLLAGALAVPVYGNGREEGQAAETEQKFDAKTFITDHVADSHEWHLFTKSDGSAVAVYLPVIIFDKGTGMHIFTSRHIAHGHIYKGFGIAHEGKHEGRIVRMSEEGHADEENIPLDFSITKAVFGMMVSAIILVWLMLSLAASYRKRGISAPRGFQGFLEPVVVFIRDDVAIPNIGEKKY
ncbi:MAG: F0F1 ATP synthase subunit A, partial [Bacteroidales bacterium]|nr:F0F1 ATP synthase subunit A [Bacteroidales bacterium]